MMLRNFAFSHIFILFGGWRNHIYRQVFVACSVNDNLVGLSVNDVDFSLSKSAKHPLSQNMPIERSALYFRSGKMCACSAAIWRVFCGSKAVCDE